MDVNNIVFNVMVTWMSMTQFSMSWSHECQWHSLYCKVYNNWNQKT